MLFGLGVSCCILYSIVSYLSLSCSGSNTLVGKRELICLQSFTCNNVVSVRSGFLFLLVLKMGCVILWHSLGLPYNNFKITILSYVSFKNEDDMKNYWFTFNL